MKMSSLLLPACVVLTPLTAVADNTLVTFRRCDRRYWRLSGLGHGHDCHDRDPQHCSWSPAAQHAVGDHGFPGPGDGRRAHYSQRERPRVRRRRHYRDCDRHVCFRWSGGHQCFRHTHLRKYRPIHRTQYQPEGRSSCCEWRLPDRRRAIPSAAGTLLMRYTRAADPQCGQPELLRGRHPEVRHQSVIKGARLAGCPATRPGH